MTSDIYIFSELKPIERYKLLCGIVVPRPIALVTSLDSAGRVNAAPFSFFNVFSEEPAQIVLGLQHKAPGEPKDTTRNLTRAKSFVVNMVDEPLAETMNLCATDFPPDVSEIEALGIETAKSTLVDPPRIAAAPFALECRRSMSLAFHETRELLIGEVLAIHARSDLTDAKSFYTDPHRYRPIGRLAGSAYCRQGDVFEMRRLPYEEWRKQAGR
jgi:flavin reductase (DIM6/NTAB) family NADH-FMN oxidoreductase RutF